MGRNIYSYSLEPALSCTSQSRHAESLPFHAEAGKSSPGSRLPNKCPGRSLAILALAYSSSARDSNYEIIIIQATTKQERSKTSILKDIVNEICGKLKVLDNRLVIT
jgi:hypothetical protein